MEEKRGISGSRQGGYTWKKKWGVWKEKTIAMEVFKGSYKRRAMELLEKTEVILRRKGEIWREKIMGVM